VLNVSQEQQEPAKDAQQQDQGELQVLSETSEPIASPPKKKRVVKRVPKIDEEAISPRRSYWPLILAFALTVLLMGAVTNDIILAIGAVLVVIAILGWSFERR
jgi:hypothetical protein